MTPNQFVQKWSQIALKEMTVAQSHFHDVCALIGHATPLEADPKGEFFTFEAAAYKGGVARSQVGGNLVSDSSGEANVQFPPTLITQKSKGRADVWFQNHFIWEYKGAHADLDKAYQQLLLYRESLGNPPLLITSDTQRIILHTNFTNTVKRVHVVDFDSILSGQGVELLRRAFADPQSFKPDETQEQVTRASAEAFVRVARTLQGWAKAEGRQEDPERLAHFLIRILFALFAEDMKLLPENVFTKLVSAQRGNPANFRESLRGLFAAMRDGQMFGYYPIRYFDGGLFEDDFVPDLPGGILHDLAEACAQNWASVEPSIFGTLFVRVIDESQRAQLGAHYTNQDDIMLVVEPVLMQPLREEWQRVRARVAAEVKRSPQVGWNSASDSPVESNVQFHPTLTTLRDFAAKIAAIRVLDPACGSGNFLYVALRLLLDLQKEVIVFAAQVRRTLESSSSESAYDQVRRTLTDIPLTVSPHQLYGIEINPYAHELAQITVWIGYLQWRLENGFAEFPDPVLRPLQNIENKDAILAYDAEGKPIEPDWPEVEVVIGNPPFLGDRKMRGELGDQYVEKLRKLYANRIPGSSDLVCYWFEKARQMIAEYKFKRVGLLATQAIRGGSNRTVLERIKQTGDIFLGWSDRKWIQNGVAVHVSMIGFDDGTETIRKLDNQIVRMINPDLTSSADVSSAKVLEENQGLSFIGTQKSGAFDISESLANEMLADNSNPNGRPNSDVVKPWVNGSDITGRRRDKWIIYFPSEISEIDAALYKKPFDYLEKNVKEYRKSARDKEMGEKWWVHWRSRPAMQEAVRPLHRYIITPRVAKYRLFVWMDPSVIADSATVVIAREDDYFLGIMHSTAHELWARRLSTQLRDAESGARYSPSATFETFPFPWPPGEEPRAPGASHLSRVGHEEGDASATHLSVQLSDDRQKVEAIADAARQLDAFRNAWLFPPEREIGVTISASMLNKRTLTHLYNALTDYREKVKGRHRDVNTWFNRVSGLIGLDEIETLDHIHTELDRAVLSAYGWPAHLGEEEVLGRLLELNLRRAAGA